jgi:hypothetical protein
MDITIPRKEILIAPPSGMDIAGLYEIVQEKFANSKYKVSQVKGYAVIVNAGDIRYAVMIR